MSNNSSTEGGTYAEKVIVGICLSVPCGAIMVLYSMCLHVIVKSKLMTQNSCYMIMFHMGLSDLGQLFFIGILGGAICIAPGEVHHLIRHASAAVGIACWFAYTSFAQVMAFDRFCHIFWPTKSKIIFSTKITKILISICWLHGLLWVIVFSLPNVYNLFDPNWYSPMYPKSTNSDLVMMITSSLDFAHSILVVICYSLIYMKIKFHTEQMTVTLNIANAANDMERKVLFQSLLICCLDVAAVVSYVVFEYIPIGRWSTLSANALWMASTGSCPIIYLTFSSLIRENFKQQFCMKGNQVATSG